MSFGKSFILFVITLLLNLTGYPQPITFDKQIADSLEKLLPGAAPDSNKVNSLVLLSQMYFQKGGSTKFLTYAGMADSLSQKINYVPGRVRILAHVAFNDAFRGNWPKSFAAINKAMPLAERAYPEGIPLLCIIMSISYVNYKKDMTTAKSWVLKGMRHPAFATLPRQRQWPFFMHLTEIYTSENKLDSAAYYGNILKTYFDVKMDGPGLMSNAYRVLGDIEYKKNNYKEALDYYREHPNNAHKVASVFEQLKQTDSAIHYAKIALELAKQYAYPAIVIESSSILARLYAETNPRLAYQYLQLSSATKDTVYNSNKLKEAEELTLASQKEQFERENRDVKFRNRIVQISLLALAAVFLISTLLFFRSNRIKQTANKKLEKAYAELKTTQAQLVQSEKMASLGELTAGIAHEIQNPLNFVNNFSEVSNELIDEMKEQLATGNGQQAVGLADNIKLNLEKINFHGKRADAIVKGMLQHSRTSSGQKQLTDINTLADEYLRLTYHGLRAKDNSFNVKIESRFDNSIDKINIIPQEIGRVILNLINNAFFAVSERQKQSAADGYEPTVAVTTKKINAGIELRVIDNGNGISQKIVDKIFQPFFTTKPAGQGTGLGLSLAYDIVKAHGGEIIVQTKENEGSEFIIQLPTL